jgi:hypothetical protein
MYFSYKPSVPEAREPKEMTLTERVARALCASQGHNPERLVKQKMVREAMPFPHIEPCDDLIGYPLWHEYEKQANAAIKAMCEWLGQDLCDSHT